MEVYIDENLSTENISVIHLLQSLLCRLLVFVLHECESIRRLAKELRLTPCIYLDCPDPWAHRSGLSRQRA